MGDLEAALDGLMDATEYAESIGADDLARRLGACYQDLADAAPSEHWDTGGEFRDADDSDKSAAESWEDIQRLSREGEWDTERMLDESQDEE